MVVEGVYILYPLVCQLVQNVLEHLKISKRKMKEEDLYLEVGHVSLVVGHDLEEDL